MEPGEEPKWMANYSSALDHPEAIRKQFQEDEAEGLMERMPMSVAQEWFKDRLRIAALGAIEKSPGSEEFRIIFDGTHGVLTNREVRVRDQVRCPTVPDLQAMLYEASQEQGTHFFLLFDIRKAHRVVPVVETAWGLQACRIDGDVALNGEQEVWVNRVGTFGMGSAAYWWGREGACLMRATHCILVPGFAHWALLYADDGLSMDMSSRA